MTKMEIAAAIEAETRTLTWSEATPGLRIQVIAGLIDKLEGEGEKNSEAGKTPKKQRKQRTPKSKPAPLTQHAGGGDDVR